MGNIVEVSGTNVVADDTSHIREHGSQPMEVDPLSDQSQVIGK